MNTEINVLGLTLPAAVAKTTITATQTPSRIVASRLSPYKTPPRPALNSIEARSLVPSRACNSVTNAEDRDGVANCCSDPASTVLPLDFGESHRPSLRQ